VKIFTGLASFSGDCNYLFHGKILIKAGASPARGLLGGTRTMPAMPARSATTLGKAD